MSNKPPPYLANFDSATAMLKALSRFLNNKDFPALGQSRMLEPFARMVNWLPNRLSEKVFEFSGALEAIPPKKLSEVSAEEIARWAVSQYPQRRYIRQ